MIYLPAADEAAHEVGPGSAPSALVAPRRSRLMWSALNALVTLLIAALLATVAYCALTGTRPHVSRSDSMRPHSQAGDILMARWAVPIEEANVGDVIIYRDRSRGGDLTAHRMVSKKAVTAGGAIVRWDVTTKGDANDRADETWRMQAGGRVAVETLVVPGAGYVARFLTQPVGRAVIGGAVLLLLCVSLLAGRRR
ncbi:MAG: signal peptidase I [Solirubrobacteraceae bacterium]|nr:signal peptidase I [Solirubrobacteraceae bacterium]